MIKVKGVAQADATRAQVHAFVGDGAEHQLRRIIVENLTEAIVHSPHALVPNVSVRGGTGTSGGGGTAMDALLAMATADFSHRFKPPPAHGDKDVLASP